MLAVPCKCLTITLCDAGVLRVVKFAGKGEAVGRNKLLCKLPLILLCFLFDTNPVCAQELAVLGGLIENTKSGNCSFLWQLDYRDTLGKHLAYSFTYLNEGHLPDHHRDGYSGQLWLRADVPDSRLSLAAGAGPYYYFDTTQSPSVSYNLNDHGWGALVSLAATWYTESPWLFQLRSNWVAASDSIDTFSAAFGIGYQLDRKPASQQRKQASSERDKTTNNEITAFIGQTSVFTDGSPHSPAVSIEYRRGLWRYVDWTVAWLYEGDNDGSQMNGLATQLWAARAFVDDRLALSIGAGPYIAVDRLQHNQVLVSGIATMSAAYRFHPRWGMRASWNRIITDNDRDADIWLAGISYLF